ncbi:tyrosine-type recombinase/integrase [Lysinibacillus antri]|uniref:Site-specific integrase n=1 Tax=Lysinibacillus antri TaxID=2498145 RepID=A0A432LAF4_9BACI|nr:tyrosine-type recombinase/integrase [Lysinibacillus antri]RUL50920.1 site-specific integrase [Lysinibacillus antri]
MANLKANGVKKAAPVSPIKRPKDLKKIYSYLKGENLRNFTVFVVGVNVLLRAGDLLSLKWSDVLDEDQDIKKKIMMTEEKTDKRREVRFNEDARSALELYKQSIKQLNMEDYIFKSRKGTGPITVKTLHRTIKETCMELGIKGNFGTHTLRKTGAYHIYINNIAENPSIISYLQKILNHSSQATTLRYIGIESEEIDDIFDNLKLFQ